MPKLNVIHIFERMQKCVQELEAGKSYETRNLSGLLSDQQYRDLQQQVQNRKGKKLTTHEVQTSFMQNAFKQLKANLPAELDRLTRQREVKAARIFLDAYFSASCSQNPMALGNAALQRNNFRPYNSNRLPQHQLKRDAEIKANEAAITKHLVSQMSEEQRDQYEFDQAVVADLERPKKRR